MKFFFTIVLLALCPLLIFSSTPSIDVPVNMFHRFLSSQMDTSKVITDQETLIYINLFPLEKYKIIEAQGSSGKNLFFIEKDDSFYDIIKNNLRSGAGWEGHLFTYFNQYIREGSIAIDIGAHVGTHTVDMSKCVGTGTVIAFEPQAKIYRELVWNMILNQCENILFYRAAIGDEIGTIELPEITVGNEGHTGVGYGNTGEYVDLITLDSLNLNNVSFIKIDVEQYEDKVIEGARETILRNRPVILIEIMGEVISEYASPEDLHKILSRIATLENMGYRVYRVGTSWDYLALP